jgi:hypothetical protein
LEEITNNLYQTINNYFESLGGLTGEYTVITGASLVSGALRFYTTKFTYTNGILTAVEAGTNIDITTTTCT